MKIAGYEKMSLVDYDGKVATTVFTAGCNFKCAFCHNSSLVISNGGFPEVSDSEFFSYLEKRRGILDGVCISGGEPTLQPDLPSFCEKIKALGYAIKLDTNGTSPDVVKFLHKNGLCDYFAMDIKSAKQDYSLITRIPNFNIKNIEKTVEYFLTSNVDYEFRTTLIKEFHNLESMKQIGEWIKNANKYFLQKFVDGKNCIEQGLTGVDEILAQSFKALLSEFVKNTQLRGYDVK